MNKTDMAKIIALVKVAFPRYMEGFDDEMKIAAVNYWMEILGKYPVELVFYATKEYLFNERDQYQSDNVPLLIRDYVWAIQEQVNADLPWRKFRYPALNDYVTKENDKAYRLKMEKKKAELERKKQRVMRLEERKAENEN